MGKYCYTVTSCAYLGVLCNAFIVYTHTYIHTAHAYIHCFAHVCLLFAKFGSDGEPQFTEQELVDHVAYIQGRQDTLSHKKKELKNNTDKAVTRSRA